MTWFKQRVPPFDKANLSLRDIKKALSESGSVWIYDWNGVEIHWDTPHKSGTLHETRVKSDPNQIHEWDLACSDMPFLVIKECPPDYKAIRQRLNSMGWY